MEMHHQLILHCGDLWVEGLHNSYSHVCRFYLGVLTNLTSSMVVAGY